MNFVSSFRAVAMACTGLAAVFFLAGCEPKVPSPKNPAVTVPASVAIFEADALAKEKEQEARTADSKFKVAAKKIQSYAEIDLAELTAAHDEAVEKATAQANALREATATAIRAAEERRSMALGAVGQIGEIASQTGIPGLATLGGLLTGAVGIASAWRNKKKADNTEQIAARIVDSIDVLKTISPEVASAIKANSKVIAEWQGPHAVSFINKVQQS